MADRYDLVFLGGGPAGYQGAIRAAQLGARTAVVEKGFLGGVCLNRGCIPTKTVRASAEVSRTMRRAGEFGFKSVEVTADLTAILARKERVVHGLRSGMENLFRAWKIDILDGLGRLKGFGKIEVEREGKTDLIEAEKIVIASGSRPGSLPIFPESPRIFLADEMLNISYLPAHLLVVGGGAVGVEMAVLFRELGSQVTLVEMLDQLLPYEDREMAGHLQKILQRRKIKVLCNVKVEGVREIDQTFQIRLSNGSEVAPDTILQAVGRKFNTEELGLKELGVALEDGRLMVDKTLQTNIPGLYGAGDVIGGWMLAHVAFAEGIFVAEKALGKEGRMDYRVVPRCVFSLPEYAAVGVSEEEARLKQPVKIGRFPFKSLGMGQAMGEPEGLVKIIAQAQTDQILGAHIIGAHAADLISEIALAMRAGLPSRAIMETIHTHPTMSEAVLEVVQALHGKAIHIPPEGVPS
jgi:dihydrolipoamide dehydrogenase